MQRIIKIMLADAGLSSRDLADTFNTTKASAGTKVNKGIYSTKDFLKVATACGAVVTVKLASGIVIPLTLADLENETKSKGEQ